MSSGPGSAGGTGGMRTKLVAAQRASAAGIVTVLFNGTRADVLEGLAHDRLRGTRIHAGRSRVAVRRHWLQNAIAEPGGIVVDAGAAHALVERGASLLPGGVLDAAGDVRRGDMVEVRVRDGDRERPVAVLAVKVVDCADAAVAHIRHFGSDHTEVIATRDAAVAERFVQALRSAVIMVNASSRFSDGGELGLGAEIGISTTRLHAYGPMGLEALTIERFVVRGEGQARNLP